MSKKIFALMALPFLGCTLDFDKFRHMDDSTSSSTGAQGGMGGSTTASTGGETSSSGANSSTGGGGETTTTTTTSTGGGGSSTSTGGSSTGGAGGTGGGSPVGCDAGTQGTPDTIESWGNEKSAGLLIEQNGSQDYQYSDQGGEANKLSFTLGGNNEFPGQFLEAGLNGVHLRMKAGGQDSPQATYLVQGSAIPYAECEADLIYSEECLESVAKDFRCQNGSGEPDCPAEQLTFVSQNEVATYDLNLAGSSILVVEIDCQ